MWINFAELAGKYRIGQCSQLALTSTNTLLFGTTICSCLVGMGGFLYWRRAFWICCLTSSRAASNVGVCTSIFGKSGTWTVQPSGDKVQSTGYEKHKIRMTQNPGYGIGISSKQRHKRHYRHARTVPGVWGTPQKCVCGYPNAMLAKHVYPQNDDKQTRHPHKFVYALKSESLLIHPKILTRKSESVLIHSLR